MERKKNTELNFLYLDDKYNKKENKTPKKSKKKKIKNENTKKEENQVFSFDDEIVIGVTKIPNKQQNQNRKKKSNIQSNKKTKNTRKNKSAKIERQKNIGADKNSAPRNIQKTRKDKKTAPKKTLLKGLIKWTILLTALACAIIFFMMTPLFNISEINIVGNNAISKETIVSLSDLKIGDNIYKNNKKEVRKKIKQNAYIESVNIKRSIPNKLEITVKERTATYMLEYANSFAYINNQGYILEITGIPLDIPVIKGYTTLQEEIEVGKRLAKEDLDKLETVLKIMEVVQANEITNKINVIDISDKQNYILQMNEEKKTIYLGDASSLSNRMLYLKAALEDTKGLEGEIFVNGDLIKEKAFFRQK